MRFCRFWLFLCVCLAAVSIHVRFGLLWGFGCSADCGFVRPIGFALCGVLERWLLMVWGWWLLSVLLWKLLQVFDWEFSVPVLNWVLRSANFSPLTCVLQVVFIGLGFDKEQSKNVDKTAWIGEEASEHVPDMDSDLEQAQTVFFGYCWTNFGQLIIKRKIKIKIKMNMI